MKIKKLFLDTGFLLAVSLLLLAGCAMQERQPVIAAPPPPPTAPAEIVTVAPGSPADWLWVPGRWDWRERWVWVPGRWALRPRPDAEWMHGDWSTNGQNRVWMEGHWR